MSKALKIWGTVAILALGMWLSGPATAADPTSCATPDAAALPAVTTCYFDLTASPSSTQTPSSAVLNGGIFTVPAYDGTLGHGFIVGTGFWDPFVRIQEHGNGNNSSNGIEAGFNTDGRDGNGYPQMVELDNHDKGGSNWNHSIRLGDIPIVTVCDGGGSTGANCKQYYEFLLDTNEQGNSTNGGISMDEFKVFTASTGDLHDSFGADDTKGKTDFTLDDPSTLAKEATLRYDMDMGGSGIPCTNPLGCGGDASILMDYRNFSGSGNGVDLQALVPYLNFSDAERAANSFVYLYSKFGWTDDNCNANQNQTNPCKTPDGTTGQGVPISHDGLTPATSPTPNQPTQVGSLNFQVDAGFEEWSIRKNHVPLPSTALLLGLGLIGLGSLRRGRKS